MEHRTQNIRHGNMGTCPPATLCVALRAGEHRTGGHGNKRKKSFFGFLFCGPCCRVLMIKCRGYSLVEVLIYSAILGLFFGVIVSSILSMMTSYKTLKVSKNLNFSAISVMERLEFEIRRAEAVSVVSSNPPKLILNTSDASGNPMSMEFSTSTENAIILKQNGADVGKLMIYNTTIDSLVFTKAVQSGVSEAVKIDMTITNESKGKTKTETFHNTIILRGSYKT